MEQVPGTAEEGVLARELDYHERLYSGFAQQHFARPAVRALRAHMVRRILAVTGADRQSRVLSLGCGIGDTELLLAPHVREMVGIDLSPAAVKQARADAALAGRTNAIFVEGALEQAGFQPGSFDVLIAIFFLHHLPGAALAALPSQAASLLKAGGRFYSLDPSRHRLSGKIGELLFPHLMRKYQTPDERELDPEATGELFRQSGFDCRTGMYDFVSSPLAGLFPGWNAGYRAARWLDGLLLNLPAVKNWGSNFEIIARWAG